MEMFLVYFGVALLVTVCAFFISKSITWIEALSQLVAQGFLILILCVTMKYSSLGDHEIINALTIGKHNARVSCEHSYKCHCYQSCSTDGQGRRRCREICQTCYEHSYDVSWYIDDSIGRHFYVSRVDRQGLREPPRYTISKPGEGTSGTHWYTNYIKADPDSLFRSPEQNLKITKYPDKIYDLHRLNRVVNYGISIEGSVWNEKLSALNGEIGPSKQVNVVLMFVKDKPRTHALEIQSAWQGAKKNDVVVVIGGEREITWAEVIGISYPEFKAVLKGRVEDYGRIDLGLLDEIKKEVVASYKRRPMKEFEYLRDTFKPTLGMWIFGMIASLITSIGLSIFFHLQDPFENGFNFNRRRRW